MVDIPDQGPGCNIIIGSGDHIHISPVDFSCISRVGCFGIDRFHNVIGPVKGFVPDQLDLYSIVRQLFHHKNGHILLLVLIQGCTQNYGVNVAFHIVGNRNVVYEIISVQVQVIDHGLLIIQALFKSFQGLRLLEQIHYGIEVKVVSRQTQVFFGIVLRSYRYCSCGKDQK
jgi:hypothetical protein